MKLKNNLIRNNLIGKKTISYFVLMLNMATYSPKKNYRDNSTQTKTVTFIESQDDNDILPILKTTDKNKPQVECNTENSSNFKDISTQTRTVTFTDSNQDSNDQNQLNLQTEENKNRPIGIIIALELQPKTKQTHKNFNKKANDARETIHVSRTNENNKERQTQNPLTVTAEEHQTKNPLTVTAEEHQKEKKHKSLKKKSNNQEHQNKNPLNITAKK